MKKAMSALLVAIMVSGMSFSALTAEAGHKWKHRNNGNHYGWRNNHYRNAGYDRYNRYDRYDDGRLLDWKTRKIIKGGVVGAGVGAGAGLLMDKPVGRTALVGAGVGSGVQAVRYSRTMQRHPIARNAAYGALAGAGASQLTRNTSLGKGALWGGAIGAGVGAIRHLD